MVTSHENIILSQIHFGNKNCSFNSLRPRQNGCQFPDDIFKCIFLNENVWIPIKISLNFFPQGPIDNIPALVQIMAWRRPGDKPLFEPMMMRLPMHICVTRPQWVKHFKVKIWSRFYLHHPYTLCYIVFTYSQARLNLWSFCLWWWHSTGRFRH